MVNFESYIIGWYIVVWCGMVYYGMVRCALKYAMLYMVYLWHEMDWYIPNPVDLYYLIW